ncbi:MAG TPA: fumarylacetoacetate hydrolase family protein [Bacteroidales bacterium]|nr:fumarylacetoacetate hydrolase family protein [Bacteroidales bacterium]HPB57094.1 fumarylacetoacetate hydrolase family protein [Bacteroidales bacterium]HPZ03215.1 fumarylacetoacetate hydrolase family protein [Bacteroidales bacterium]HQB74539.1 fumarylacetoacetate hydrolase family protein [Bacteroidales bacterium]
MKIICVGLNYRDHIEELGFSAPDEPIFFLKPETALLVRNRPFFLPDFSQEIHYEVELLVRINKLGKYIQPRFAHTYYNEIGLGVDFTARDIQERLRKEGLPWEQAKSFDGSAVVSPFIPKNQFSNLSEIRFSLQKNGETVQIGNSNNMIFNIDQLISYISQYVTLKIGDIIFTGTPVGVGPVSINDRLTGYIEDQKMFDFKIK